MPTFPVDAHDAGFADSFMSSDVLGRPGEYELHGASQRSAVKSNLYPSGWVGGSAPGSFSPLYEDLTDHDVRVVVVTYPHVLGYCGTAGRSKLGPCW